MSKKLSYNLETLFAALHRRHPALYGITIRHHDQSVKAGSNEIVIKATVGDKMLAAFKGYEASVETTYRSSTNEPSQNDAIESAIRESVQNATPGCVDELKLFNDLVIEPSMDTDRSDSKNQRRRVVRFQVFAKEKS